MERVINQVKIAGGGEITAQIPLGEDRREDEDGRYDSAPPPFGESEHQVSVGIDLDADDDGGDDLTFEAIDLVRRSRKASASLLQRHLKVGYARAARILDIMEEKGVIGPGEGAKARKVYVE